MLTIVLFDILLLIALLMLSIPLPYCFGGALLFMAIFGGVSMKSMMLWGFNQIISSVLLASPLFILAGVLMGGSGIAQRLLDLVDSFVGRIKGGLGAVSVVTCAIIGAISGSGFTGVAAVGPIMIPRMVSQGYPLGYSTALVTMSSVLGLLIPPSIIMILYGWVTETSILAAFLSTLGPGLLITFVFCVINFIWARKFDLELEAPMPMSQQLKRLCFRTWNALPALAMPLIILGGIYGGVFTPTEAAAVAAIFSIPVGFFVYKGFKENNLRDMLMDTASSIGSIMTMIFFCLMLSQTFVMLQVPQAIVKFFFGLTQSKTLMLLIINAFLFVVGMIVNDSTGMILCAPLLFPLAQQIGIHPIHFAAIMGVNLAVGGVTPPYASILYLGMRVGKCEFKDIFGPTMVFLLVGYIPIMLLTSFWPALSLAIPRALGFL